ncbi:MAG: hypothetical protein JNM84_12615, partial [Planctomycetes bacterium]|nr:hypothetical protein [Planctomycetota bacterium]
MADQAAPLIDSVQSLLEHELRARGSSGSVDVRAYADAVVRGRPLPGPDPFGGEQVLELVSFDADRITSFVFASDKPRVVQGASRMLEAWNGTIAECWRHLPPEHRPVVIYSAGGGGLLLFAARAWNKACVGGISVEEELRRSITEECPGLRLTVATLSASLEDFIAPQISGDTACRLGKSKKGWQAWHIARGLPALIERLARRLRERKDGKMHVAVPPSEGGRPLGNTERCPSCHTERMLRSASDREDELQSGYCETCRRKHRLGMQESLHDDEIRDFGSIAKQSGGRRRDLGFLYADGNSMGKLLTALPNLLSSKIFSRTTQEIFQRAVTAALDKGALEFQGRMACVSLLSGGDEVILILPADRVLPLAVELDRAVQAGFEKLAGDPEFQGALGSECLRKRVESISLGIGCVIAPPKFPVRDLRDYAARLQKVAKGRFYGEPLECECRAVEGRRRTYIDYEILRSSSAWNEDPAEARKSKRKRRLTAKPFRIDELDALVGDVKAIRKYGIPRSQLYALREMVDQDPQEAIFFLRYQCARHSAFQ